MMESELAKKIIDENLYMVLATASSDGEPWVSPVFFAYDEQYNFYWVSNKDAWHSKLLQENPQVAISIFDSRAPEGDADGVYIKADVTELAEIADIRHGMTTFNNRVSKDIFKIKDQADVIGDGVWRIYQATPTEVSKLGYGTYVNGQYVDQRVTVSLV